MSGIAPDEWPERPTVARAAGHARHTFHDPKIQSATYSRGLQVAFSSSAARNRSESSLVAHKKAKEVSEIGATSPKKIGVLILTPNCDEVEKSFFEILLLSDPMRNLKLFRVILIVGTFFRAFL